MMKSWLITILAVLLLVLAYYLNIFKLLATNSAMIIGIVLFIGVFAAAFFILGNPLANRDKDE